MFYPAYIHSDPDGSASGFSLMFQAVILLVIRWTTLSRMREVHWPRTSKPYARWMKSCRFQALWKHIWSSVRRTLLAGNGCWWISI